MKSRKLWLGLGAAALSSTVSGPMPRAEVSPAAVDAAINLPKPSTSSLGVRLSQVHQHGRINSAKADAGGEGGEGSAARTDADSRLDPMIRFYRDIQLVRGHIRVGNELVNDELWTDALPHFLHPVEELYDKLAPQIKELRLKPFKQQLNALAQTVKAKNAAAYEEVMKVLEGRFAGIDAGMKAEVKDWMPFAVQTALETMRSAIGEYGDSIENGKFTKAVEYQDSRGFVLQSESLLQSVESTMSAKFPDDAAKALAELAVLKTAWPAALPPASPVLDAAQVTSSVSRVELALGRIK